MGSAIRADRRVLQVKRQRALDRPDLSLGPKPAPADRAAVEAAIAAGRFTKLPPAPARGHRKRTWTHG